MKESHSDVGLEYDKTQRGAHMVRRKRHEYVDRNGNVKNISNVIRLIFRYVH
jgi:hypothetical protein